MELRWRQRLARRLQRSWWQRRRDVVSTALLPLSWLYRVLWSWHVRRAVPPPGAAAGLGPSPQVPVVIVGNVIVGGGGKTPTVIAVVQALRQHGWHPGVISRGYGRTGAELLEVEADTPASSCGDEPRLIRLRAGVPVVVGRDRPAAAAMLCRLHPEVDVIVCDDGLQHLALRRDLEVIVFDARGIGNGCLLPAGPLREPWPRHRDTGTPALVLYTSGVASTDQPGHLADRRLGSAVPLASWLAGTLEGASTLEDLPPRKWLAVAGVAHPAAFFEALRSRGLQIDALPLPDHHAYDRLPWGPHVQAVLLTEKDAVKLRSSDTGGTQVRVVGLDFRLPAAFVQALLAQLGPPGKR